MAIHVNCINPLCAHEAHIPDRLAGKRVRCPKCGTAQSAPTLVDGFVIEDELEATIDSNMQSSLCEVARVRGFPAIKLQPPAGLLDPENVEDDSEDEMELGPGEDEWLEFCASAAAEWREIARKTLVADHPIRSAVPQHEDAVIWNIQQALELLPGLLKSLPLEDVQCVRDFWLPNPLDHIEGIEEATRIIIEKLEAEGRLMLKKVSGIRSIEFAINRRIEKPDGLTIILWRQFRDGGVDGVPHIVSRTTATTYSVGVTAM